jgi:hypothetical protein
LPARTINFPSTRTGAIFPNLQAEEHPVLATGIEHENGTEKKSSRHGCQPSQSQSATATDKPLPHDRPLTADNHPYNVRHLETVLKTIKIRATKINPQG